jgi:phosphopantothenoylcysteine decarboxylase/phosphopantothenate--cysteine ligase
MRGKKVLITAGPTHEHMDPVRFIGNHSTGKMGYAIVQEFLERGAEVLLISGPTKLEITHPRLTKKEVVSASEMLSLVQEYWTYYQIGVFCAAVADYRPVVKATEKIKKKEEEITLTLVKNPDILAWAGVNKQAGQFLVGFALETNDALQHAKNKIVSKNLDAIVVNSLENEGAGFGHNTNKIAILSKDDQITDFPLKLKQDLAHDIVNYIDDNF